MRYFYLSILNLFSCDVVICQINWQNVNDSFGSLPQYFNVYKTSTIQQGQPFIAYYAAIKLKQKKLQFTTDTTYKRRLTPQQFYEKNSQPLLVVNGTFFSFTTNQNLNTVIKDGKLVSFNFATHVGRGKDTFTYTHVLASAIGISKKRTADVAWLHTDSSRRKALASQVVQLPKKDSLKQFRIDKRDYKPWRVKTAIGGGPVLIQNGQIEISNNQELKFAGKAINDKHPRTCMGYTQDGFLIVMVVQGRTADAAGATLTQCAEILQQLGCVEAINLDGGGSSCMLINGKQTIFPSDKGLQRAVPAVFLIAEK
jgi:exopolysaccharide biosynthesis protein